MKKRRITVASGKAKSRRLQNFVCEEFIKRHPILREGDIRPAIMGESGTDVKMSPAAKDLIPFDIEAKNQEKTSIWGWLKQAEENSEEGRIPLLVFKRNHSKTYAVIEFDNLMKLLYELKSINIKRDLNEKL
jgi:hypothetical protein